MKNVISGTTRLLGVMGSPISHSHSPAIHNAGYEELGLDYVYLAFNIDQSGVKSMLDAARLINIAGLNITMPCKKVVMDYLDEIDPQAKAMGAVNTVVNENGKLKGYNTDGLGMLRSIEVTGTSIKDKKITLFGAGGAATAIIVSHANAGAKAIDVFNRSGKPTEVLSDVIKSTNELSPNCAINLYSLENEAEIEASLKDSEIVINATSLGMEPNENTSPIKNTSLLKPNMVVADAVYIPVETKLLKDAKAAGCVTADGRGMLLYQGVIGFKLFTGEDYPVEKLKDRFYEGF